MLLAHYTVAKQETFDYPWNRDHGKGWWEYDADIFWLKNHAYAAIVDYLSTFPELEQLTCKTNIVGVDGECLNGKSVLSGAQQGSALEPFSMKAYLNDVDGCQAKYWKFANETKLFRRMEDHGGKQHGIWYSILVNACMQHMITPAWTMKWETLFYVQLQIRKTHGVSTNANVNIQEQCGIAASTGRSRTLRS